LNRALILLPRRVNEEISTTAIKAAVKIIKIADPSDGSAKGGQKEA
jgi:hypothetical protein